MALQLSYTDEFGIVHPEAYAKLEHVRAQFGYNATMDTDYDRVLCSVYIYHSKTSRDEHMAPIGIYTTEKDEFSKVNLGDFVSLRAMLYGVVKKVEPFLDAIDV